MGAIDSIKEKRNKYSVVSERLGALRALMARCGIDAVIVPTGDPHMSEYVCDHFKCREYITGFTGSDGTAVIMRDETLVSGLWTDSRYFIQAESELEGTGIELFRLGYEDTPAIHNHIIEQLQYPGLANEQHADDSEIEDIEISVQDTVSQINTAASDSIYNARVACDGRTINFDTFAMWYDALSGAGIELIDDLDLVGEVWADRPLLPGKPVFDYPLEFAGKSRAEKLTEVRNRMREAGADCHLLTKCDDISWLLNIRGDDIHCTPVPLCYLILYANPIDITDQECRPIDPAHQRYFAQLFIDTDAVSDDLKNELAKDGVLVCGYENIEKAVAGIDASSVLISTLDTNSRLYSLLPASAYIIEEANPTQMLKAVKNAVEIAGSRAAHIRDGVALTKFIYWLKTNVRGQVLSDTGYSGAINDPVCRHCKTSNENAGHDLQKNTTNPETTVSGNALNGVITEISAAQKLYELRSMQENFRGNSFDPIIAYAEHGAIVHYSATPTTDAVLRPEGLLLADTGGQYLDGTTDVTRTIVLGPVSDHARKMSTLVLKGHIALASAVFPRGLNGANLDYLAHAPLWKAGKDYGHGTGHGVGHFLSVHEGPNNIHWTRNGAIGTTPAFAAGMITSCEPGYYEEGSFGIRHESLILCRPYHVPEQGEEIPVDDGTMCTEHETGQSASGSGSLCFEELTMVPFDLDAIDVRLLTAGEREWLNDYHRVVYEKIAPHLDDEEREWLKSATCAV